MEKQNKVLKDNRHKDRSPQRDITLTTCCFPTAIMDVLKKRKYLLGAVKRSINLVFCC